MYRLLPLCFLLSWSPIQARLLRVATVQTEPFFKTNAGNNEGFLVDLMEDLVARANVGTDEEVQYRFYPTPDGRYGKVDENGRWDGLMGEVTKGEADMAVAPLTLTKERNDAVYFSYPYLSVSIVPLVKRPAAGQPMPFYGLQDLQAKLQSGNLSLAYIQHGSTERYMSNHKSPGVRAVYNISKAAHTPSPYVDSVAAGIQKVRDDPRFVFYGEHVTFIPAALNRPCDLTIGWTAMIGERFYGFIFPKTASGRQWMERFNTLIIAAQEDGTIAHLFERWWLRTATCPMPKMCACHDDPTVRM